MAAVGLQPGSPYVGAFNSLMIQEVASGEIERIRDQWLIDECSAGAVSRRSPQSF
jgi:hypothetical protein